MQKDHDLEKGFTKTNTDEPGIKKKYASSMESIGSAAFYGVCSTSMAFLNKTVITSFNFDYPFIIMAWQMIFSIFFLEFLRIANVINLSNYTFKSGKSVLWPSVFYALHATTALHALGGMSIPMYAAVKRCAPIVTLILSVILLQKKMPSVKLIFSVICITVGCFLAGLGDFKFDPLAYKYGAISVILQGLYMTLSQQSLQSMSALDVLHINSYNTVFIFIFLSFYFEFGEILEYNRFSDIAFLFCFVIQAMAGVLLNYSLFYCTEKNSALTTSLVGVLKSLIQTVVGFFTFGGIELNFLVVFGITLNLFGGVLYTFLKYQEKMYTSEKKTSIL